MLEKGKSVAIVLLALTGLAPAFGQPPALASAPSVPPESRIPAVLPDTTASVLWQRSMNVFRRFNVEPEKMFEFYGQVLGFQQLGTINFGNGGAGVARFQAGAQEFKLTRRVDNRQYQPGGVTNATGLRLVTFFFADEGLLTKRFVEHGLAKPEFQPVAGTNRTSALVADPDGQAVELVVVPGAAPEMLAQIEVGLTVADLEKSRAFYRSFVGLAELPPAKDARFKTTKYSFRHGATTVTLRSFGKLPADTGSGGIQYVVSNVDIADALAKARSVPISQPLSDLASFQLRTVWLDDPDGITNYYAETAQSRQTNAASPSR